VRVRGGDSDKDFSFDFHYSSSAGRLCKELVRGARGRTSLLLAHEPFLTRLDRLLSISPYVPVWGTAKENVFRDDDPRPDCLY
jgi:hypothetical protein